MKPDWRWLAVLPVALVGSVIAQLITILVTAYLPDWVSQLVGSATVPAGFVMLGARVAPSRKVQCAGVLAVLWIFTAGALFGIGLFVGQARYTASVFITSAILNVIGAIGGLYGTYVANPMPIEVTSEPGRETYRRLR